MVAGVVRPRLVRLLAAVPQLAQEGLRPGGGSCGAPGPTVGQAPGTSSETTSGLVTPTVGLYPRFHAWRSPGGHEVCWRLGLWGMLAVERQECAKIGSISRSPRR